LQVINPKKDLPVGLIGSLGVVTTLYLLMAATIILIVPYTKIDPKAAFAAAFQVCQPIHIRCLPSEHDAQPTRLE
jgi:amino acid transporter